MRGLTNRYNRQTYNNLSDFPVGKNTDKNNVVVAASGKRTQTNQWYWNHEYSSQFKCCYTVRMMEYDESVWETLHNADNNDSSWRCCWFNGDGRTTPGSVLLAANMIELTSPKGDSKEYSCCCCWFDGEVRTIPEIVLKAAVMSK